jgi:protein SCO1/2
MHNTCKYLLCAALLLLAACSPRAAFELTNVTGADFGRDFALTDHHGQPRTLEDFRGKVVIVFFGFTHCPDMCPTKLTELAQLMHELGTDARHVQVLFITIDPERDTQESLAKYVPSFNPDFLGLYGDAAATARVAKEFHVIYQKQPLKNGDYTMDHSTGTFVFDPRGQLRVFGNYGYPQSALLHDVRLLLWGV